MTINNPYPKRLGVSDGARWDSTVPSATLSCNHESCTNQQTTYHARLDETESQDGAMLRLAYAVASGVLLLASSRYDQRDNDRDNCELNI